MKNVSLSNLKIISCNHSLNFPVSLLYHFLAEKASAVPSMWQILIKTHSCLECLQSYIALICLLVQVLPCVIVSRSREKDWRLIQEGQSNLPVSLPSSSFLPDSSPSEGWKAQRRSTPCVPITLWENPTPSRWLTMPWKSELACFSNLLGESL